MALRVISSEGNTIPASQSTRRLSKNLLPIPMWLSQASVIEALAARAVCSTALSLRNTAFLQYRSLPMDLLRLDKLCHGLGDSPATNS